MLGLLGIVAATIGLLIGYFRLQVLQHNEFQTRSEANRIRLEPIVPARGLIVDRNGELLADNVPAYRLELIPEQVRDMDATLTALRQTVAISDEELQRFDSTRKTTRRFKPIPLKLRLSEIDIAKISIIRHRYPGVEIVPYLTRQYPYAALTSHVVGYVGRQDTDDLAKLQDSRYAVLTHVGKTGIERYYEQRLRGEIGHQEVETNAENRPLRVLRRTPSMPGQKLQLTIDIGFQQKMVEAFDGQHGAAVAIDPANGEILGMVSLPSYDPNLFVNGISIADYRTLSDDPARPQFNRNVLGGFAPGSTLKPFMALAGLAEGVITPQTQIFSSGMFYLPGQSRGFGDWRPGGHGWTNLRESLAQSVNTYYFKLAVTLGIDRISRDFAQFGFGQPTGIDLVGEAAGVLPSRDWKRKKLNAEWYPGDSVNVGIGQGFWVVTPLQLAQSTAMLAANGQRHRPHLLKQWQGSFDAPLQAEPQPAPVQIPAPGSAFAAIRDGLVAVLHSPTGTARATAANAGYLIAGKTGTAQRVSRRGTQRLDPNKLPYHLRHQALFVGYAPADKPMIALAVVVEHGGSGSRAAAPVARRIFDAWVKPRLPPPAVNEGVAIPVIQRLDQDTQRSDEEGTNEEGTNEDTQQNSDLNLDVDTQTNQNNSDLDIQTNQNNPLPSRERVPEGRERRSGLLNNGSQNLDSQQDQNSERQNLQETESGQRPVSSEANPLPSRERAPEGRERGQVSSITSPSNETYSSAIASRHLSSVFCHQVQA